MSDERKHNLPLYRSGITGSPVDLRKARIAIVGENDLPKKPAFKGTVEIANPDNSDDRRAIKSINMFFWGTTEQDIFGKTYDVMKCKNLIARPLADEIEPDDVKNHGIVGNAAIIEESAGFLHIVVFHVRPNWQNRGVGKRLLESSTEQARVAGLKTIKLGTTNDNIPALYFYQKMGFTIEEVIPGEVLGSHGGPPAGFSGIPVRDEIRMKLDIR